MYQGLFASATRRSGGWLETVRHSGPVEKAQAAFASTARPTLITSGQKELDGAIEAHHRPRRGSVQCSPGNAARFCGQCRVVSRRGALTLVRVVRRDEKVVPRQLQAGSVRLLSMAERDRGPDDLLEELQDAYPGDVLAVVGRYLQRRAGATEVELLLADYSELSMERLDDRGQIHAAPVLIETSTPGQCYLAQQPIVTEGIGGFEVHVPVTLRADRI